jgi:hypothetical protein
MTKHFVGGIDSVYPTLVGMISHEVTYSIQSAEFLTVAGIRRRQRVFNLRTLSDRWTGWQYKWEIENDQRNDAASVVLNLFDPLSCQDHTRSLFVGQLALMTWQNKNVVVGNISAFDMLEKVISDHR